MFMRLLVNLFMILGRTFTALPPSPRRYGKPHKVIL